MSEYIINGTLLTNIADAVRSVDGSTSTLTPAQMTTRLNAVKSSIDSALSALTSKEIEVPSGSTIHGLAELIASIKAGGSGDIRIEQGSVTFAEEQNGYTFVEDSPDIFIVYIEDDSEPVYSSSKYIWMMVQDTRLFEYYGKMVYTCYILGYNKGSKQYYTPLKGKANIIGRFASDNFNGVFGAKTYKWYAIYGVTAT